MSMMKGSAADMMEINSKSKPKGVAKLRSIEIEHADNGGHVVTHRFHSQEGPYREPETHVFGKAEGKKMLSHVAKHMGVVGDEDGDKEKGEPKEHKERSSAGAAY